MVKAFFYSQALLALSIFRLTTYVTEIIAINNIKNTTIRSHPKSMK